MSFFSDLNPIVFTRPLDPTSIVIRLEHIPPQMLIQVNNYIFPELHQRMSQMK